MQAADTIPPFDTQRAVEHLQAGGLSSGQAVAITRTLVDATANLATKADLAALGARLQTEITGVKTEIDDLKQSVDENRKLIGQTRDSVVEVREEIGRIRIEITQSHASTVRMMLFMSFGIIGAIVGLLRWVLPQ